MKALHGAAVGGALGGVGVLAADGVVTDTDTRVAGPDIH